MKYYRIIAISLTVLALVLAGSCEVTIYQLGDASGSVVDADTGAGIEGATVTLYQTGTTNIEEQAVTDASGNYNFKLVSVGVYDLVVSMTGMVFTSEKVAVAWDEESETLPTIAGFTYSSATDAGTIKIITLWDNNYMDVDSFLSLPNEASAAFSAINGDVAVSSYTSISGSDVYDFYVPENPTLGFSPENPGAIGTDDTSDTIDRILVYNGNTDYASGVDTIAEMALDTRDGGGPETINIYYPTDNGSTAISYQSSGGSDPSKLPAGDYTFTGVMEYYLSAYHATSSVATVEDSSMLASIAGTNDANPRVFVFASGVLKGYFTVPTNIDIKNASIFRINCFFDATSSYFQILPDTQIAWSPRGISDDIIVVPGRPRRK